MNISVEYKHIAYMMEIIGTTVWDNMTLLAFLQKHNRLKKGNNGLRVFKKLSMIFGRI